MKVSIAVPSRNYGRYIDRCLGSIASQNHADYEVLIADGGSDDDSPDVITRFTERDPRFRLVSRQDRGQADAVNRALSVASGDIACFLNADDEYMSTNVLSRVCEAFTALPAVQVVTMSGLYIDESSRPIREVRLRYHPLDGFDQMKRRTAVLQPATFWLRQLSERYPFRTDMHYAFDALFFYQLFLECKWAQLPDRAAGYRLHGSNKSMRVVPERIVELARLEAFKYGENTFRPKYLRGVARVVRLSEHLPRPVCRVAKRVIHTGVNAASFAAAYRLPGI
jgi:glycosyltransferase involved in cell wall biosynthesis